LFRLTSLNLNGIRSATRKGLADWVRAAAPDCICVQELRAQMSAQSSNVPFAPDKNVPFHV